MFSFCFRQADWLKRRIRGKQMLMPLDGPRLSAAPEPQPEPSRWRVLSAAVAMGLGYALAIYGLIRIQAPDSGMLLFSFLIGAPMAASIVAVGLADPHRQADGASNASVSALTVTIMLLCAGVVLGEGAVCLLMAAPIFYLTGILAGVISGRLMRRRPGRMLCLSLLVLPLVGLPAELDRPPESQTREVVTRVSIDAAPEIVWRTLAEVRHIRRSENKWNVSHDLIGVPRPIDARLDGRGVGAVRHVAWAKGVRFEERLIRWEPGREMAWSFHISPEASRLILDEHLTINSDYLRLEEGGYRLHPRADGGTDVVLTTRYWIRTPMNGYAAAWGRLFLGDFHANVLGVIRARAEDEARSA